MNTYDIGNEILCSRLQPWEVEIMLKQDYGEENPAAKKINPCEEEGCCEADTIKCIVWHPEDQNEWTEDVFYYCGDHAEDNGFCVGCGTFSAGLESFDFIHPGLCDNCYDEVKSDEVETTAEDYHPGPWDW